MWYHSGRECKDRLGFLLYAYFWRAVFSFEVNMYKTTKVYFSPSASSSWFYYEWSTLKPSCFTLSYGKHNFNFSCWLCWRRLHQTINRRCNTPAMLVIFLAFVSIRCMTATTSFIARSCVCSFLFTTYYYTHIVLFPFMVLWLLHLPLRIRRLHVKFKAARLSGPSTKHVPQVWCRSFVAAAA